MNSKTSIVPLPVETYHADTSFKRIIHALLQLFVYSTPPTPSITGIYMEFGKFVWINEEASQRILYNSGAFGKGSLSRANPTWLQRTLVQNAESLEEITAERRKRRRNKDTTATATATATASADDTLTANELLEMTCRKDLECFQLDLYEAFFLQYAINALRIVDPVTQKPLGIQDSWSMFCKTNINFCANYAVYHFYRSLAWVPKNGSKFGVDFVLYQSGPSYRHADYAIVVIPLRHDKVEEPRSWEWFLRLNRTCSQVKKTLILCYVTLPQDISLYMCLDKYEIRQVIYKRWSPQKNRE